MKWELLFVGETRALVTGTCETCRLRMALDVNKGAAEVLSKSEEIKCPVCHAVPQGFVRMAIPQGKN
jgi:hypothetical protein